MFSQRQRLRRIAVPVLLAWLFMLTTGIVNACVLASAPGDSGAIATRHESATATSHAGCGMLAATSDHGHHSRHQGMSACAKAFNAPSTGAQALKHKLDPITAVWLAPAPVGAPLTVAPVLGIDRSVADPDPGPPAIPIRIAFLRLTL